MSKKQIIITLIALLLVVGSLIAVLLLREEDEPELTRFTTNAFGYFDTVTTISGYAASGEEFQAIADVFCAEL